MLFKQCKAFIQECKDLEHYETDPWAAERILDVEEIIGVAVDPCVGTGVLIEACKKRGIPTVCMDIKNWGYKLDLKGDFINPTDHYKKLLISICKGNTVFINPPFKHAAKFVEKAFEYGAVKVICFQRHAWRESKQRRKFWEKYIPQTIWLCGERATCWRHDIPKKKRKSGSSTAHSWYIFYACNIKFTMERILYKT